MTIHLARCPRWFVLLLLGACCTACSLQSAQATTEFQKVFVTKYMKEHEDKDFTKFVKKKVRCYICHQGSKLSNHKLNNAYGEHLAKILDHEADKKDTEKIDAALETVGQLPFDPDASDGKTYAQRIAASKLPAGELDDLKVDPEVALFDGKSLAGWVGATESYEVREGVLASIAGASGRLFTEAEYSDFIFRFEFRLTPGANNGIGIRAPLDGNSAYQGIELQVLDNTAEKYAELKEYQFHGSAYGIAGAKRGYLKPVGEWNQQEVLCNGRKIKVVLNKKTILRIDLDKSAPDGVTIDGENHPGLSRTTGHIGFLGHGDVVEFRNLRVVDLGETD